MKSLISKIFVVIVAATLIVSCSSKSLKQASLIPKDANIVLVIDQNAMKEKLKSGNFQMDSVINSLITSIDSSRGKKLVADWKNSGVNTEDKIIMFMTQGGGKNSKSMSMNVIVSLSDAAKFEAFLKSQDELKTETVIKGKTYSSLKLDKAALISWTNDFAMVTMAYNNSIPNMSAFGMPNQSAETVDVAAFTAKTVEGFYSLKDADKITSVKVFNEMFDKKADAYMFSSTASLNSAMSMMPFQLPKLEELLKDNYTVNYLNFENGKIVMDGASYFNDRVNSLLKQYGNGSVKLSMLENFPAKNTNGAMLLSFKPEMIGGILKELELESIIDMGLSSSKVNFTRQDLYKCLKGDIAVAVGDFALNGPQVSGDSLTVHSNDHVSMKYLFTAEVGDKISLNKILDQAVQMQAMVNNGGVYTVAPAMAAMAKMYVRIDDKNIVVASDENTYTQYAAKTTKATLSNDFTNNLSGKYLAMYVNVNSFLTALTSVAGTDAHGKIIMDKALATFDNMSGTCDNFKDGKIKGEFVVKLKNDKENSLVSLANFFKVCVEEGTKIAKENKEAMMINEGAMIEAARAADDAIPESKNKN